MSKQIGSEKKADVADSKDMILSNSEGEQIGKILGVTRGLYRNNFSNQQYVIPKTKADKTDIYDEDVTLIAIFKVLTDAELDMIEKSSKSHVYGIDVTSINETAWDAIGMKRGYSKLPLDTKLVKTAFYAFNVKKAKSSYE